jgi:methionyl-tRNA formyltransferase
MIYTVKTPISDLDNLETIHDRLADLSGDALLTVIKQLETGSATFTKQDSEKATYAEKILKKDEIIDFNRSASEIDCQIRALTPFPFAHCNFDGKMIKIIEAHAEQGDITGNQPGEILSTKGGQIKVACGNGVLVITRVFPESKRKMNVLDFVNGSKIKVGDILR